MAGVDIGARDNPPINDDLDNVFNYDVDNDLFKDVDINMDVAPKPTAGQNKERAPFSGGLGLDEEIKVSKKRAPIAKLDETRLLSQAGIPKLRRLTRERLKFRGKGHEFSDVARMLKLYQLWLDDLYPRAKFGDGLAMIEKLGHSKRMQFMRKEWISEGKAKRAAQAEDLDHEAQHSQRRLSESGQIPSSSREPEGRQSRERSTGDTATKLDEGVSKDGMDKPVEDSLFFSDGDDQHGNVGSEDDLDAILAEEDGRQQDGGSSAGIQCSTEKSLFADDEEAMADMGDFW